MQRAFFTGAQALAETLDPGGSFQLEEVRLHLSAAGGTGSENFTVKVDSANGSEHDVVLAAQDMQSLADYVFHPTRPKEFAKDDAIVFSWANAARKTWGLEVLYRSI
jgi:hypothetical protein